MCRIADYMCGDRDLAEQLVMDVFVRMHARWERIDDPTGYLHTAVINTARTRLRRRQVESRANALFHRRSARLPEPAVEDWVDGQPVLAAVRRLPERQRAVVVLHYLQDMPVSEVAVVLGCTVGTVKSQLSKARATLARILAEEPAQ